MADGSDFLDRIVSLLEEHHVRYCVIGGQGVNAYADPVVSLDLDIVVAVDQMPEVEAALTQEFKVERFEHSLNISASGSDLRLQIQTDPRYFDFVERAQTRDVLGMTLQVADVPTCCRAKSGLPATRRAAPASASKTSPTSHASSRCTQSWHTAFPKRSVSAFPSWLAPTLPPVAS